MREDAIGRPSYSGRPCSEVGRPRSRAGTAGAGPGPRGAQPPCSSQGRAASAAWLGGGVARCCCRCWWLVLLVLLRLRAAAPARARARARACAAAARRPAAADRGRRQLRAPGGDCRARHAAAVPSLAAPAPGRRRHATPWVSICGGWVRARAGEAARARNSSGCRRPRRPQLVARQPWQLLVSRCPGQNGGRLCGRHARAARVMRAAFDWAASRSPQRRRPSPPCCDKKPWWPHRPAIVSRPNERDDLRARARAPQLVPPCCAHPCSSSLRWLPAGAARRRRRRRQQQQQASGAPPAPRSAPP
jgi:hypothetical protein